MDHIFFENWVGIFLILVITIIAYFFLIFILRVSGKRTLAKMNAYDFVVTVALGSILGSVILTKSIPLLEGIFALALLIGLQYGLTFISVRSKKFQRFLSSQPTLLLYNGEPLESVLKNERVSLAELNKAIRSAGFSDFKEITAIVLETTGDLTVIKKINKESTGTALTDVQKYPN
jgi:uncharacterized membrane protein YcaP (DUF421 family)